MVRVILGFVKGALVGGGIGYGWLKLGLTGSVMAYVACAIVGALVGIVAGRAPWRAETIWTPVVKMVVGAIIGVGLAAIGLKLVPDASFHVGPLGALSLHSGPVLAPIVGILYGIFVEVDDGGKKAEAAPPKPKA